jgi:neurofibromin 1
MDDDLIYQILISLSNTLMHFQESDTVLIVSMLRCLARVIPGLLPDSRYAPTLFWLAVAVLQLSYIPLYAPALELLLTTLGHLDSQQYFVDGLFGNLLDVRKAVGDSARKLDQLCGINLDTNAGFSLVAILYKGVRHPNTRKLTIATLTEFLRLSAKAPRAVPDDEPLIGPQSVAFFTALLPIAASSPDDLKALFVAAGVDVVDEAVKDLSTLSVFQLLAVPDNSTAILLMTLVVTMLGQASSDNERLVIYRLLAEASQETPEVVAMTYDQLLPRITTVLTLTSSNAIVDAVTLILERAMTDKSYPLSSDSLYKKNSFAGLSTGPSREQLLEDVGMKGLTEMSFTTVKMDRLSSMAKWVAALIESLTM